MKNLSFPIHTGTINGKPVRFFEGQTAVAEFPWHVVDDLYKSLGLSRELRRDFLRITRDRYGHELRTVATREGPVVVAPHYMAQGFIDSLVETGRAPKNTYSQYVQAGVAALNVLMGDRSKDQQWAFLKEACKASADFDVQEGASHHD